MREDDKLRRTERERGEFEERLLQIAGAAVHKVLEVMKRHVLRDDDLRRMKYLEKVAQTLEVLHVMPERPTGSTAPLFVLRIELGNDAMATGTDVGRALVLLGQKFVAEYREFVPDKEESGKIPDINGNTVGAWEII